MEFGYRIWARALDAWHLSRAGTSQKRWGPYLGRGEVARVVWTELRHVVPKLSGHRGQPGTEAHAQAAYVFWASLPARLADWMVQPGNTLNNWFRDRAMELSAHGSWHSNVNEGSQVAA